jgi:hypothetical protein
MAKCLGVAAILTVVVVADMNIMVPIVGIGGVTVGLRKYANCPESCKCSSKDRFSAVDVQCGDQKLTSVPQIIGNDMLVSILNLSFNTLKDLKEDALKGYESTEYLYLQYCKLESIDEIAFWGVKNLTVVDLSNNRLLAIPANVFRENYLLDKLILRNNDLLGVDPNTPLLTGPPSLTSLDLQSCKLSQLSLATFSLLPNLRILDISSNKLEVLNSESLCLHRNLKDLNLENNQWKCGPKFKDLLCWVHRMLVASHNRTLKCRHENNTWETWTPEKRSSQCGPVTSPSPTEDYKPNASDSATVKPTVPPGQDTGKSSAPFLFNVWWLLASFFCGALIGGLGVPLVCRLRGSCQRDKTQFLLENDSSESTEKISEEKLLNRKKKKKKNNKK